jgi:lipopolysaccharide transport system permease protein
MLRDLKVSRGLGWRLTVRDISAQYRQTALGYLWAILPPALISMIWVFLNYSQIIVVKNIDVPYPVYALTGTVFWQLFLDALNAPLNQLSNNRAMLTKVNFPKEALLLSGMAQVLFSFFIKLLALVVILLIFRVPVHWAAVFIFFPISGMLIMGTLIGTLLVPIGVLYKDVQQAVVVIAWPLMFLTPVVYPQPAEGLLATIMRFNPLTPLFITTRDLLYKGIPQEVAWSVIVWIIAFLLFLVGWVVYRVAQPILIERMEA